MCGICGILRYKDVSTAKGRLDAMTETLVPRGPDQHGVYLDGHVALSMRRLSIIDPETGNQPLTNEDGNLILIANGEIYNFKPLRTALRKAGHQFSTHGDCEVLLHLYEDNPESFLDNVEGMFAFALYDKNRRCVLFGRDRLGEKPLYWSRKDGEFCFSSTLESLLKVYDPPPNVSMPSITDFLYYGCVPDPYTLYLDVHKLEAGTLLHYDLSQDRISTNQYWDLLRVPDNPNVTPLDLEREFSSVVGDMTYADVPVGISLSGGVDSSLIAWYAREAWEGAASMTAFTVGYEDGCETDESLDAVRFAESIGIPCIRTVLGLDDLRSNFSRLMQSFASEPVADIAGFSIWSVSEVAKSHSVPVLLTGLGGDELFWGYPPFRAVLDANLEKHSRFHTGIPFWARSPRLCGLGRHPLAMRLCASEKLPAPIKNVVVQVVRSLCEYKSLEYWNENNLLYLTRNIQTVPSLWEKMESGLFHPAFSEGRQRAHACLHYDIQSAAPPLPRILQNALCHIWLASYCLALSDRVSMYHSVEVRNPFLNPRFVTMALQLDRKTGGHKIAHKKNLLDIAVGKLPASILEKPKTGFTPPYLEWTKLLIDMHREDICGGFLVANQILNKDFINKMLDNIPYWANMLYRIIVLEQWHKLHGGSLP